MKMGFTDDPTLLGRMDQFDPEQATIHGASGTVFKANDIMGDEKPAKHCAIFQSLHQCPTSCCEAS